LYFADEDGVVRQEIHPEHRIKEFFSQGQPFFFDARC